jgi:hypothetical protein
MISDRKLENGIACEENFITRILQVANDIYENQCVIAYFVDISACSPMI